jgi:hypothetical protein
MASDVVPHDQPCFRCGYSLRGLSAHARCPECDAPVQDSLRGDLLVYADPDYVLSLQRGSGLVMWSTLFLIAGGVIAVVFNAAIGGRSGPILADLLLLSIASMFALGWWFCTTPDLGRSTDTLLEKRRRVARSGAIALVLYVAASVLTGPLHAGIPGPARGLLGTLVFGFAIMAGINYLRALCRRLPDQSLSGSASTLAALAWVCCAARITHLSLTWLFPGGVPGIATVLILRSISVVGGLTGLIAYVMYCVVISRFRDRLDGVSAAQRIQAEAAAYGVL